MNNQNMFIAIGEISDDLVADAAISTSLNKRTKRLLNWKPLVAACAVIFVLASLIWNLGNQPIENTLIIKAYAASDDGQPCPTQLALNERIQLVETGLFVEDYNNYYAFDLSLVEGMYLQLSAVDDSWNIVLDKSIHYSGEDTAQPYWALTEGNEIATISTDFEGKVFEEYVNGSAQPRMKGNSLIWRVNEDGMNRCIIDCFDKNFRRVVSYYLEIVKIEYTYYAEIVMIK